MDVDTGVGAGMDSGLNSRCSAFTTAHLTGPSSDASSTDLLLPLMESKETAKWHTTRLPARDPLPVPPPAVGRSLGCCRPRRPPAIEHLQPVQRGQCLPDALRLAGV